MLDVFNLPTSHHDIWQHLITTFEKKSITEILYLCDLLNNLKYKIVTYMNSHIESFKDIVNQLTAVGVCVALEINWLHIFFILSRIPHMIILLLYCLTRMALILKLHAYLSLNILSMT